MNPLTFTIKLYVQYFFSFYCFRKVADAIFAAGPSFYLLLERCSQCTGPHTIARGCNILCLNWPGPLLAACDVPDGGRFPFQQSVSLGSEPPVSQVGQVRTAWQQYTVIHKPRTYPGILESQLVSNLDQ